MPLPMLRSVVVVAVALQLFQEPPAREQVGFGSWRASVGGVWFVEGSNEVNEDVDWVEDENKYPKEHEATNATSKSLGIGFQSNGVREGNTPDENSSVREQSSNPIVETPRSSLRGSGIKEPQRVRASPWGAQNASPDAGDLQKFLQQLFSGEQVSGDKGFAAPTRKKDPRFTQLLENVFLPRIQTPPKYTGALECLNQHLYQDTLSRKGEKGVDQKTLMKAYNYLLKPPKGLGLPELFVELRLEADRRLWEKERVVEIQTYESRGDPIPERLELDIDELAMRDINEPRLREEELSSNELGKRLMTINGWLRQQYRLRVYFQRRQGTLQGTPGEALAAFDPGRDCIVVSIEQIQGLGYGATLDPEPEVAEEEV